MNKSIIPGILTDSFDDLQEKINAASGFCERASIDVIDGVFANNVTVMPESFSELIFGEMKIDVQLMVNDPVDHLGYLHSSGTDRVFGHIERMGSMREFMEECQNLSIHPGLALDLYTPINSIEEDLLSDVEGLLLMSVKAGFSGQQYVDISSKVKELRDLGFGGDIVVDGGMNKNTIPSLIESGANQFSVTSKIWKNNDPALSYKELAGLL
ncbi:hypothetical protein ACFL1M_04080 [Patescibacteria group bacterium]